MELKPQHKNYILKHKEDIRDNNWEKFFEDGKYPDGIGEPLYLAKLPFMEELKRVPQDAFSNCSGLTSIRIPSSATSIGEFAFYDCNSLASVTFADGSQLKSIGYSAFYECTSLTNVYITDIAAWCNIKFADSSANPLYYAKNLYLNNTLVTDLVIPEGVTSIGDYAFEYYASLTSIRIPASVTIIGDWAFSSIPTDLVITYGNTKAQWEKIYNKDAFNDTYFTVHCTDGDIVKKMR